jgi:HD-GYP domain-containing protein (c-di-GMP phosphodiesterase class II)
MFVMLILLATTAVTYFVVYKIAFLNFYFLPIILAGYYLGTRKAVLGAVLCALMISIYAIIFPNAIHFSNDKIEIFMSIVLWSSFLILAAAVVGNQHEMIKKEVSTTRALNTKLSVSHQEITVANSKLKEYAADLEKMVSERTAKLNQSKEAIESLKQKVEETLFKSMDRNVAKLIIDGRLRTEKRQVSILFSDLCSFTEYSSNQSPEVVVQQLNRYLEEMEAILLRYNGHIDKYLGDGIMAEFGAPIDFDKHRLLAVLAALKMQDSLKSHEYPWKMRIGISSGLTILGMIGSKRQSYTSIGDTVNLAARLEASCPPGSIIVDENTAERVRDYVKLDPFDDGQGNRLKGFANGFRLYEVTGRKDVFEGNPAFPPSMVDKYLPLVQNCGIPDEITLPVEALDGSVGHSQKVAVIAAALGERMSFDDHQLREIAQAAFAADCGKAIIHHHTLNRQGRLMEVEYENVKKHPEESVRTVFKFGFDSKSVHAMIRHAHERMDGRGYPDGLKGQEIPLGSRIIAVADAYSALTSYRPYREKWETAAALQEIERSARDGQFDPEVVRHLLQALGGSAAGQKRPA